MRDVSGLSTSAFNKMIGVESCHDEEKEEDGALVRFVFPLNSSSSCGQPVGREGEKEQQGKFKFDLSPMIRGRLKVQFSGTVLGRKKSDLRPVFKIRLSTSNVPDAMRVKSSFQSMMES